jgi:O-antigen/teichoic acid export membrane protein
MKSSFVIRLLIDALGRGVSVLLVVVLARTLGVSEFGKVAFGFSAVNVLYYLTDCGTAFLYIREMGRATAGASHIARATTEKAAELRFVWENFLGLRFALLCGALVVGAAVTPFIWKWDRPLVMIGLLFWMLGNSFSEFLSVTGNAVQRISVMGWVTLAHRACVLTAVAIPLLMGKGLLPVALAMGAGSLTGAAVALVIVCRSLGLPLHPAWRWHVWLDWIKTSLPLAAGNIFSGLYPRMGMLVLPMYASAVIVGYYGSAQRLFEVGYMVAGAFIIVPLPQLPTLRAPAAPRFRQELRRSSVLMGGLALLWLIGGVLFAPLAVRVMFGQSYMPAASTLRLLFVAGSLGFLNYFGTSLMILFHRLKRHALNQAIAVAVAAGLTHLFARFHGMHGAAAALIVTEACVAILTVTALKDVWKKSAPLSPDTAPL